MDIHQENAIRPAGESLDPMVSTWCWKPHSKFLAGLPHLRIAPVLSAAFVVVRFPG